MLQYRPLEGELATRGYYSPHRDLAYCGIGLLQSGLLLLDRKLASSSPELKEFMRLNDLTEADTDEVARRLADMFNLITSKYSLEESWEKSKLDKTPIAARALVFTYLGESLICAIYQCMRDQLLPETDPPSEIKEFNKLIIDFTLSQRHKTLWDRVWSRCLLLWKVVKTKLYRRAKNGSELQDDVCRH